MPSIVTLGANNGLSRFAIKPELVGELDNITRSAKSQGGLISRLFDNDVLNSLALHIGHRLPQLMDFDLDVPQVQSVNTDEILARLQNSLEAKIPAILARQKQFVDRRLDASTPVHRVSIEERCGAQGLVPIGVAVGTISGTDVTFAASAFQGVSVFKKCRMSFNDPTGALLYIKQFSVGTNNRFAIANSSFTSGFVTSAGRFREQHAAFQPGDGFHVGTLQLDNSTQLSITGVVLTGTAPATQILCSIWGVPTTPPSGYTEADCSCATGE